ncbi:MAG: class IV adenylate cyclase [Candidatus Acidiferrales bacterium]
MRPHRTTNREIEIKLRISDLPAILRKIGSLGAASQGRVLEENTLYDTPESGLRRRGMLLRVRVETPAERDGRHSARVRVVLTAKAPLSDWPRRPRAAGRKRRYKERAERELLVPGASRRWTAALVAMGFRPAFRYEKYRTTFRLPALHLDLDETPVGVFLELEGSLQAIERAARALEFAPAEYLRCTYWDLYAAACRRRVLHPKNMLFRAK